MIQTVNILGLPYAVKRVPYIVRDSYLAGQLNMETQEIKILDTLTPELSELTLLHETVHAILKTLKFFDEDDDEKLVQGIAIGFQQFLNNNPLICTPTRRRSN